MDTPQFIEHRGLPAFHVFWSGMISGRSLGRDGTHPSIVKAQKGAHKDALLQFNEMNKPCIKRQ